MTVPCIPQPIKAEHEALRAGTEGEVSYPAASCLGRLKAAAAATDCGGA